MQLYFTCDGVAYYIICLPTTDLRTACNIYQILIFVGVSFWPLSSHWSSWLAPRPVHVPEHYFIYFSFIGSHLRIFLAFLAFVYFPIWTSESISLVLKINLLESYWDHMLTVVFFMLCLLLCSSVLFKVSFLKNF